ncbi:MAG: hypothetical protein ACOVP1_08240 [Bacteroidia bacterium]
MKNIFKRCMACIALILTSSVLLADERINNDTLIIKLKSGSQMKLVGFDFKRLQTYNKADSMMTLFFADYEKSMKGLQESDYPKEIHYLVAENGKRRMKIQDPDFADGFNLDKEAYQLNENLSSIHFVIYDLISKVQIHLYPQTYAELKDWKEISLNKALENLKSNEKDFKRNYLFQLNEKSKNEFEKIKLETNSNDQLEIHADVSTLLIGNQWTPAIGLEARLMFLNRFNKPSWSVGLVWNSYGFSDFKEGQFKNFTYNTGIDGRLMFNMNQYGEKTNWLGIELGLILPTNNETPALNGTSYKLMVHNSYNNFGYSFGTITTGDKKWLPVVGFRLPF